jgi:hypothetical protein
METAIPAGTQKDQDEQDRKDKSLNKAALAIGISLQICYVGIFFRRIILPILFILIDLYSAGIAGLFKFFSRGWQQRSPTLL